MRNNFKILTVVVVLASLRSTIALEQQDSFGIEAEYLNIITQQRSQFSSFVSNAEIEITNGTNVYSSEMEAFREEILHELGRFDNVDHLQAKIDENFEDFLQKIVREPRKIADEIYNTEKEWKELVEHQLDVAVQKLVTNDQSNIARQCWVNAKEKLEANFDFFWNTFRLALKLTRRTMLERIEKASTDLRSKVTTITDDLKSCRNKVCAEDYVSQIESFLCRLNNVFYKIY